MAAAVKALNARIRANPVTDYVFSTHLWGPVSNFGIPIAAVMDTQKDVEIISGRMTLALTLYSSVFMRYALAVTPKNYLLFGCHVVNFSAQVTQGYRYLQYWNFGGREKVMAERAGKEVGEAAEVAKGGAKDLMGQARQGMGQIERKAEGLVEDAKVGLRGAEGRAREEFEEVKGRVREGAEEVRGKVREGVDRATRK